MLQKTDRRLRLLGACACVFFVGCSRELTIKRSFLCDDFAEGVCRQSAPKNGVYSFELPEEKTKTWFDFAYYMYFHSRQTPGMRVEFSRKFKDSEQTLRSSLHCAYRLQKGETFVEDHMEGIRWDEDGSALWCFDYLGTMLVKYHKKYGSIQSKPSSNFFPVTLTLSLEGMPGAMQVENIGLEWKAARSGP